MTNFNDCNHFIAFWTSEPKVKSKDKTSTCWLVTGKASGQELLWIDWKCLEKALATSDDFMKCVPSAPCSKSLTTTVLNLTFISKNFWVETFSFHEQISVVMTVRLMVASVILWKMGNLLQK